ncbi:MAG TPA: PQQ-binding-like beta-propeller repeat protein [Daejeonella sp.]|nr:PQQ-binding-like beta-propeller repeat protein [Daejeonella sp.]
MKRIFISCLILVFSLHVAYAQSFKFAFVSDTHIGSETGEEDLRRTVADINLQKGLDFVLLTGDITEMGTNAEIKLAKSILSQLTIPMYILPGNHDTGWSESGGVSFIREFGYDKFVFEHKGFKFIGCASGPYVRMSDGHIPRDATVWLDSVLTSTPKNQPIIFANHYPLDNSLDNWYEVTDRLKKYNTQFAMCGHGHNNRAFNFEDIPATMGRSNLRAKAEFGAYNIVEVRTDSALFSQRNPGSRETLAPWRQISLGKREYDTNKTFTRPLFSINEQYPNVKASWSYHSNANVVSTPVYGKNLVIYGNSLGEIEALSAKDGRKAWSFKTGGAIYSSPEIVGNRVVLGSGDGFIYCLNVQNGKLLWKLQANASVLGSPVVEKDILYIGASDQQFRAIDIKSGRELWSFHGVGGAMASKPLIYQGKIYFGAWDRHLYALNLKDGSLAWKWNNGSDNRMFSPAMCTPVAADGVVYIVAPDRYITALDAENGQVYWRSNAVTVRESIGISADKKLVYGKTMNDEIVAFKAGKESAEIAWKMNCNFGYEHVPSMLIEKDGLVYFGTKNSTVYAVDPQNQQIKWAYKTDNSMANTVNVVGPGKVVVATMDGKVTLLQTGK